MAIAFSESDAPRTADSILPEFGPTSPPAMRRKRVYRCAVIWLANKLTISCVPQKETNTTGICRFKLNVIKIS